MHYNAAVFEARLPFYRERLVSFLNAAARLTGAPPPSTSFNDEALSLGNVFDLSSKELIHFAFGTTVSVVEATLMATAADALAWTDVAAPSSRVEID